MDSLMECHMLGIFLEFPSFSHIVLIFKLSPSKSSITVYQHKLHIEFYSSFFFILLVEAKNVNISYEERS